MQVIIVKSENVVAVDGVQRYVDCSALPANFHALQWDGAEGEIEYRSMICDHCGVRSKKPNEKVSDLAPYDALLKAWSIENTRVLEERAKAEAERKAQEEAERKAAEEDAARKAAELFAQAPVIEGGADATGPQG